ncbi:hypothetical protein MFLAVUS_010473 [Mucor flavus]|uniref:Uncharacterized protein n=1 Tax=Mucor flavus TaxID=439312 RepID=A0ABP9ZCV4_9FUNG
MKIPSKLNFEYFNNNAPQLRDYESFKKHKTVQAVHPPRNKRIRAEYEEAINNIRNLPCANGEMEDHLDSLIKDTNSDGDKGEKQVISQYINYRNVGNRGPGEIDNININVNSPKKRCLIQKVPAIKHCLSCTVLNIDDEEEHNSNNRSDDDYYPGVDESSQLEPSSSSPESGIKLGNFDSFTTDETGHTYQTEDSKHYAEANEKEELIYDNSSSLYNRLAISSINYNAGLSEVYKLTPTMLDDQAFNKIKEIRADFVWVANGQEVGCSEIKAPNTSSQLVEEGQARTAEILERQLYVRIMKSKDPKEFATFGVVFNGFNIELYVMAFDFENTPPYRFYEIEKLKLPSSPE